MALFTFVRPILLERFVDGTSVDYVKKYNAGFDEVVRSTGG